LFFTGNSAWDARSFFNPGALPEFRRHQFGGTLGGRIPKSKKDFFFFAYEGKRQAQGQTDPMNVPHKKVVLRYRLEVESPSALIIDDQPPAF
jgi:hypothetical protein